MLVLVEQVEIVRRSAVGNEGRVWYHFLGKGRQIEEKAVRCEATGERFFISYQGCQRNPL
jgi:hypothetical protein